jgi:hypothetical protein
VTKKVLSYENITVRPGLNDAVLACYHTKFGMHKPPVYASKMLSFLIELHLADLPCPSHKFLAEKVGCTVWAIDSAFNVTQERGLLTQEIRLVPGNIAARPSVMKQSYYVPSAELLSLSRRLLAPA